MKASDLDNLVLKRDEVIKTEAARDASLQLHQKACKNLKDFENSIRKKHSGTAPKSYIHKGKIVIVAPDKIEIKDPDELDKS